MIDLNTVPAPRKAPVGELGLKDALVHAGWLDKSEAGRGRPREDMTKAGHVLVGSHNYRIKGMAIAKASKSTPAVADGTEAKPKVERVKTSGAKDIAELIPQMRGDDMDVIVNGKPWPMGIRGICQTCKVSLTHCPCVKPMVFLDFQTIVPVESFRTKVSK